MKFQSINIPKTITQTKGIEEINIQRLSSVIAFVGKNGSGKTRILDLIEKNAFENLDFKTLLDTPPSYLPKSLETIRGELSQLKLYFARQERYKELTDKIKKNPEDNNTIKELNILDSQINTHTHQQKHIQANRLLSQLGDNLSKLKLSHIRKIKHNEIQNLQQAIEKNNINNEISFETLIENVANNTPYDELSSIYKSALSFLLKLPHQLATDHYECTVNKKVFENTISFTRFQSLKKFIKDFLDKELSWEQQSSPGTLTETGNSVIFKGLWKINNRLFDYNEFSDGEKTLFAYALLFFLLDQNPRLNIKESIILIDEPELHLHPDSEIEMIKGIKNVIGEKGQLIIATHSINILSMLNYEEIFMVKDGQITHPSQSTPGKSLSELMSIEDRVHKLSDFLSSISTWSYINFMAQCFSDPEVIESSKAGDPQIEAFKKAVLEKSSKRTNMLLDFGAGKGRLLEQIKSDYNFIDKINYSALEPTKDLHQKLTELGATNVFATHNELPQNHFDFILLCNVLHEIPLNEWEQSLNKIIDSLQEDGHLIIIEAKVLNKGEKIGQIGYLLLDVEELQQLFKLDSLPSSINIEGGKDSTTCVIISKSELTPISKDNIVKTLIALETNTLKKIKSMRSKEYEAKELYGVGRKTAFLSQQHINARLARQSYAPNVHYEVW